MTWFDNTRDHLDTVIPFVFVGIVGILYLVSAIRRSRERNALAERHRLEARYDLPVGFPVQILAGFRQWRADDILLGRRGKDLLLTFDCSFKRWWQRQRTVFTVVAIQTGGHYPQPTLRGDISYYEIGSWRIAVAMGFLDLHRRRLSTAEIEKLWDRLIEK